MMFDQSLTAQEFFMPAKVGGLHRVLPLGRFKSVSDRNGGYYLNEHVGKRIAEASRANEFVTKVTFGFDEEGSDAPAAGWFKQLEWRADGLYIADLVLNKRAQEMVSSREYIYFAPVFHVQGDIPQDLTGLVLTNNPQLRPRSYS